MLVTEDELTRWGEKIGRAVDTPVFLGLRGPLGAGKSVLARAVARGAGVEGALPSPTFNLLFRYEGDDGRRVVHMDLYRLDDPDELWELGWEELGAAREIVLVEWPERAGDHLPEDRWEIALAMPDREAATEGPRELYRTISVDRFGDPPHLPGYPVSLTGRQGRDGPLEEV